MNFEVYNHQKHFELLKKWYTNSNILDAMDLEKMDEDELVSWLISERRIHLVFYKENVAVGCVNFYNHNTVAPKYEIGYLVDPLFEGQGVATEMVKMALEYAKNELKSPRLEEVYVKESNPASKRVLEKNDFVLDRYNQEMGRYYFYKNL